MEDSNKYIVRLESVGIKASFTCSVKEKMLRSFQKGARIVVNKPNGNSFGYDLSMFSSIDIELNEKNNKNG